MRFVAGLLVLGVLGTRAGWAGGEADAAARCPACDPDRCPKSPRECSHGLQPDVCGCCKEGVCLLLENEKCSHPKLFEDVAETNPRKFGACGEDAECVPRTESEAGEAAESACRCRRAEVSCGMDNVTYPSVCRLREAGAELRRSGPCASGPEIVAQPEAASAPERDGLSLSCAAKGFPVPRVSWELETLEGAFRTPPGDDPSVAVHCRGGPEPFTVTSWLMIDALRKTDAGTYICVAENSEGVSRAAAAVRVTGRNSREGPAEESRRRPSAS